MEGSRKNVFKEVNKETNYLKHLTTQKENIAEEQISKKTPEDMQRINNRVTEK